MNKKIKALITKNPLAIRFIKEQTEEMQLLTVKSVNRYFTQVISEQQFLDLYRGLVNPSKQVIENLCMKDENCYLLKNIGSELNLSEEFSDKLLHSNKYACDYLECGDKIVFKLKYFPERLFCSKGDEINTEEQFNLLMKCKNRNVLGHFLSRKQFVDKFIKYENLLDLVKEFNKEVFKILKSRINELTENQLNTILSLDSRFFEHIPNPTEDMCIMAVSLDGNNIRFVKNQTNMLQTIAYNRGISSYYINDYIKELSPELKVRIIKSGERDWVWIKNLNVEDLKLLIGKCNIVEFLDTIKSTQKDIDLNEFIETYISDGGDIYKLGKYVTKKKMLPRLMTISKDILLHYPDLLDENLVQEYLKD